MNFHPLTELFPLIDGAEFDQLVADIAANGLHEPIVTLNGMILDGRNRWRACEQAGKEPRFVTYDGPDPLAFVVSVNLRRRHLDASQRAMVAAKLAKMRQGRPRADEKPANLRDISQETAANRLNVSQRAVQQARVVQDKGTAELNSAVESGEISVAAAELVARMPVADQKRIVAKGRDEILRAAATIRAWDSAKRHDQVTQEGERQAEDRERRLRTAPPWQIAPHAGERVIRGYEEMVDCLVDRRRQLGWTQEVLDEKAGFQAGYCAKLENWKGPQGRVAGSVTMPLWLEALAIGFVPVAFNATGATSNKPLTSPVDLNRRVP